MKFACHVLAALGLSVAATASANAAGWYQPDCSKGDSEVAVISQTQPYYPHSATMFCLTGSVTLTFTIDAEGLTRDIRVAESTPQAIFDRSAIQAVEQWRFVPACRDGERAERSATQTIEFQLPQEIVTECRERRAPLDEEARQLLGEIGARYALLAEMLSGQLPRRQLEELNAEKIGVFDGDLARVAEFHRSALERIASVNRAAPQAGHMRVMSALQPHALAEDPELARVNEALDQLRSETLNYAALAQNMEADLQADRERLERKTSLSSGQLAAMIDPFLGTLDTPPEQVFERMLEPLDRLQSLVDLLKTSHGHWATEDNQLVFDNEVDQTAWDTQMEELMSRQEQNRNEYRRWVRSFEDYST
ncbi:MAG TPA: energy transducer TonB [Wenzhouxiangella sp.]|nr:energy transducer TonB [Wenzhouxiangella sp.]